MPALLTTQTQKSPAESYLHVMHALILRDMRTRFGASIWGYAVVVLWPCVHVFMLIAIYTFQKLAAPLGDSRPLFFATGAVPVLVFQWMIGYALFSIIKHVSSGVMFLADFMLDKVHYGMKFNPALQCAEWVRSAYYPYAGIQVNYLYVILPGLTAAIIELLLTKHANSKLNG